MSFPKRPDAGGVEVAGAVLALTIIFPIISAFNAWIVMIGLGMLHSGIEAVPALGFFPTWGGALVLTGVGHALRGTKVDFFTKN